MSEAKPEDAQAPAAELDDRPPLLGSWRNIYVLVLAVLGGLVAFFAVLTQVYS